LLLRCFVATLDCSTAGRREDERERERERYAEREKEVKERGGARGEKTENKK